MTIDQARHRVINYGIACIKADRAEKAYEASTADTCRAAAHAMDVARNVRFEAFHNVEDALADLVGAMK